MDAQAICPICSCELDGDVITLDCCSERLHLKCFVASLEAFDFKRLICSFCKKPLSYSTLSLLSPKQRDTAIQYKAEMTCAQFFRTRTELINRYKLLSQTLAQFPYALDLIRMYRELEDLKSHYSQYKHWQAYNSESVSCTEEANERIEEFDMSTRLVRLTSLCDSNNAELFKTLIEAAKHDVFAFQTNIVLNEADYRLVKLMFKAIEGSASFKTLSSFKEEELRIIKNEDNKSPLTVLSQLEKLYQQKPLIAICRCECGGVIRAVEAANAEEKAFCDTCFKQYCNRCYRAHEGPCDSDELLTAIAIRTQYRACPNCGLLIDRVLGTCEHMFCTDCFCGFDWNTREFITSNFVNPHREEWLEILGERRADYIDAIEIHSAELRASLNDARLQMHASDIGYSQLLDFVKLSSELSSKYIAALERKLILKLKIEEPKRVKYYQCTYFLVYEINRMLRRFNDKILAIFNAGASIADNDKESEISAIKQAIINFNEELKDFSVISGNITLYTILCRNSECLQYLNSTASDFDIRFE